MRSIVRISLLGLVLALAVGGCRPGPGPSVAIEPSGAESGPPAGGFAIPSLSPVVDGEISLSSHEGKVVLLDFWATWCPPCRVELPYLNKIYTENKDDGFSLIGMTVDQGRHDQVAGVVERFDLAYPVGLAGPEVQAMYGGIRAVPTKFLVDRQGSIRKSYLGAVPEAELRADIAHLLAE